MTQNLEIMKVKEATTENQTEIDTIKENQTIMIKKITMVRATRNTIIDLKTKKILDGAEEKKDAMVIIGEKEKKR